MRRGSRTSSAGSAQRPSGRRKSETAREGKPAAGRPPGDHVSDGDNLLLPGGEGLAELHQLSQPDLLQFIDGQQSWKQDLALLASAMLLQEQIAEPLFEPVDHLQRRILGQIGAQPFQLLGPEIVPMAAHQGEQSAVLRSDGVQIAPAVQEVMIHQPNHMEPVGHDQRIGEMFVHQRAIVGRQVDSHHAHQMFAF